MNDQAFQLLMQHLTQHFEDDKRFQDAHMAMMVEMKTDMNKLMAAHWMRKGSGMIISGIISLVVSMAAILLSR
jgi:hypothetical protein